MKTPQNKKLALNAGIQTYQILTNDDELCIPSFSSILLAVSYHDGRVVRTWYRNGKIEIEAVFTLLGVRIPHIGTRKALKHHVNYLNTGIRPMVCFLNARPPFGTVYIYIRTVRS